MRYPLIDEIRGLTLLSMLFYHGCWDLVYIFHVRAPWYESQGAYYWQQSICWTFIFISGFCWHFGRNKIRHGLKIFLGGALITALTVLFMPQDRVVFGILTFLGSAALIVTFLNRYLKSVNPAAGFIISIIFFALTKQINRGFLGCGSLRIMTLPSYLYKNLFTAFLGFPSADFYSTDYFSILPWIFLYLAGYYSYMWMKNKDYLSIFKKSICSPLGLAGRYSFYIYMLHQPVLYGLLSIVIYLVRK